MTNFEKALKKAIPVGYQAVDFRVPLRDEFYLDHLGEVQRAKINHSRGVRIIVAPIFNPKVGQLVKARISGVNSICYVTAFNDGAIEITECNTGSNYSVYEVEALDPALLGLAK